MGAVNTGGGVPLGGEGGARAVDGNAEVVTVQLELYRGHAGGGVGRSGGAKGDGSLDARVRRRCGYADRRRGRRRNDGFEEQSTQYGVETGVIGHFYQYVASDVEHGIDAIVEIGH